MKVIILAAGYGTRLFKDLKNDRNEQFKHLIGVPKPLLPIGERPLISYWVEALKVRDDISDIFVVTNNHYHHKFKEWAQKYPFVTLINDGTSSNENIASQEKRQKILSQISSFSTKHNYKHQERLGAVSCLQLAIDKFQINDHVLVIGGDTLFYEDFHLHNVIGQFETIVKDNNYANLVLSYPCKDEETRKYGILETDENHKVTALREKPSPTDTASRQACPCFYVLSKDSLTCVQTFLDEKKNAPIEEKDAPGHLLSWLVGRNPVHVYPVSGRFDVGNLESYITCHKYFQQNIRNIPTYLQ